MIQNSNLTPVFENAGHSAELISAATECRFSYIDDLAHSLFFADGGENELRELAEESFISEYRAISEPLRAGESSREAPKQTAEFLLGLQKASETVSLSYLCSSICAVAAETKQGLRASDFFDSDALPVNSKIAYVRNAYSDKAYSIFSRVVPNSSVVYPGSFVAVCEEVYYGRAGYCILPYETSTEGSLSGFQRMIRKYDLEPVFTCSVQSSQNAQNGQNVTRFVLLSRGCVPSLQIYRDMGGIKSEKYIRITLDNPNTDVQAQVCLAATLLGMESAKIESVPVSWDSDRYSLIMDFKLLTNDPCPFLLYLEMEVQECSETCIFTALL